MNYAQTDPRWAEQRLGTHDGWTLGRYGCYVTSFSNVATHFGKDINPSQLDNIFTDRGLYTDGGLCQDDMLSKVYPDIEFEGVYHCEYAPCDLSVLNECNDYVHEAILELDASPQPGIQSHFCRFYSYNPETGVVMIVDTMDGQVVSIADRYGNPSEVILKVVKYIAQPPYVPEPTVQGTKPEAPQPAPDAVVVDPVATSSTHVEGSVLANLPEWETSFTPDAKVLPVKQVDAFATDPTGAGDVIPVPTGAMVHLSGTYQSNGQARYRLQSSTTHPEINGAWYGLSVDSFTGHTTGDQLIPDVPDAPKTPTTSLVSNLIQLLAVLTSPILRVVGKLRKK